MLFIACEHKLCPKFTCVFFVKLKMSVNFPISSCMSILNGASPTFHMFPSPACVVFSDRQTFLLLLLWLLSAIDGGVCRMTYSLNITDDRRRADDGGLKNSFDPFELCHFKFWEISLNFFFNSRECSNGAHLPPIDLLWWHPVFSTKWFSVCRPHGPRCHPNWWRSGIYVFRSFPIRLATTVGCYYCNYLVEWCCHKCCSYRPFAPFANAFDPGSVSLCSFSDNLDDGIWFCAATGQLCRRSAVSLHLGFYI